LIARCGSQPAAMTETDIEEWGEGADGMSWETSELGAPLALAAKRCTELGGDVALGRVGERGTGRLWLPTAGASGTLP
jgi:hypothetical protein